MKKTKIVLATIITVVIVATVSVSFAAWDVLGAVEGFDAIISKNVEIKIDKDSFVNFEEAQVGKKLLPEGAIKGSKDTESFTNASFNMRFKNPDKKNVSIKYKIQVIVDTVDCSEYFTFTVGSRTTGVTAVADSDNMITGELKLGDEFASISNEGEVITMTMGMKFKVNAEDFEDNPTLGIGSIIGRDFKLRVTVEAKAIK